jgi:hypothetical protein
MEPHYIAQYGLQLVILPKYWYYRCVLLAQPYNVVRTPPHPRQEVNSVLYPLDCGWAL